MAMAARGIRIIAPIPGKNAVGVEIPNSKPRIVHIKTLLQSEKFKNFKGILPIAFGKTIANEIYIDDLAKMPHLLVAGSTGSGKSVGINTILTSLIYFCSPEKVKFLLIDPKRVELFPYQKLKHHFLVKYKDLEEQIITDTSKAVYALKSVEKEMDLRYDRLAKAGVRNIKDFNAKFPDDALPYIVVVIDELADMMITAGRDVEEPIARLAQLARAVGIHLVVATQRPSVDVITGVIKANFPARAAYQVASKIDSRTILDMMGAEQLLGYGDMLYLPSSEPKPIRIQNAFVSTEEVEAITEFIYAQKGFDMALELPSPDLKLTSTKGEMDNEDEGNFERDKMFEEAARLVVRHQQGSVSLLQRRLKLGFGRAARIMDQLEQAGIVGAPDGSKPREVLIDSEESLDLLLNNLD
jgi:S-DNA-T family DNA segregation ATPase FtsK/SpoIIIE